MRTIEFVYPTKTAAVSVTGNKCELNCKHCRARFLQQMSSIDDFDKSAKSILLSGGYTKEGFVPIREEHLKQLRGYKLNIHPGLADERQAKILGRYASVVSFDFPCGDEVIKNIYGLKDISIKDYIKSYRLLKQHCKKVIPHVLIGFGNELKTLKLLNRIGFEEIVFLVLISAKAPSIANVTRIIKTTRELSPKKRIALGCMRPHEDYRKNLDCALLDYVDAIVMPHKEVVDAANKVGFNIIKKYECCVL